MTGAIWLPYSPSSNNLFANKRDGGRRKTDRYMTWIRAAENVLWQQKPLYRTSAPFAVRIYATPPNDKKRDIDNIAKAILDRLVAWNLTPDDHMCRSLLIEYRDAPESGVVVEYEGVASKARAA